MRVVLITALTAVLIVGMWFLVSQPAEAIEYFGGKIIGREKLKIPTPGLPGTRLRVETQKLIGSVIIRRRETIYLGNSVLGNCTPGHNLLGSGTIIKGRKVMTFGICQ